MGQLGLDRLSSSPQGTFTATAFRWCIALRWVLGGVLICGMLSGCSWFRNLVGNSPEKSHRLAEQARHAEAAGQVAQAIHLFEEALEQNPNDPHVHRELARLLRHQGQFHQALEHLENAVEDNPDDVEANVELAQLYIEHNLPARATDCLDTALQNDPKHITALLLRAKLAETLHDTEMAVETYHRVLSADPNNVKARVQIAALELQKNQPSLSAPLLRSVCHCSRATPEEVAEAQWNLGIAYGQEQRWADAVQALTKAADNCRPLSADDWYRLAYAHSQLQDWQAVKRNVDNALRINPQHENSLAMLGVLRWQKQSPDAPILRIGHSVKPIPTPELW